MNRQKRHKPEEIILLLRECDASQFPSGTQDILSPEIHLVFQQLRRLHTAQPRQRGGDSSSPDSFWRHFHRRRRPNNMAWASRAGANNKLICVIFLCVLWKFPLHPRRKRIVEVYPCGFASGHFLRRKQRALQHADHGVALHILADED